MKELKNILLVSGSGRNCGKTTVACHLIGQLAKQKRVTGLKVTPHFHLTGKKQQLITEGDGFRIFRETDLFSGKDSSRMLNAGAAEVFFVQCADVDLPRAIQQLKKLIPENSPVICESGSFANVYRPGLHILVKGNAVDESKRSYSLNLKRADNTLSQNDFSPTEFNHIIAYKEMHWTLNKINNEKVRRSA